MIGAKLRQIGFGLRNRKATVGYPLAPLAPQAGYRGRVVVETQRCVGCGGCADVCPARCILVTDVSQETRVIRRLLDRCIQCGRCEEACVYDAVRLEADWENGTPDRRDLVIEQRLFMAICDRCGRCYEPPHPLDHPHPAGLRRDEPWLVEAEAAAAPAAVPGGS